MSVQDFAQVFGPRFFLEAQGTLAQDLQPYIYKFEYEDDEHKTDKLKIHVLNPGLIWDNDVRFNQGARWRCRFGYLSDISDVKNVVISKAKPGYPQNGIPSIEMVAFGLQQDMNYWANPYNWGAVQSSDVATGIAKRYGFKTNIEASLDSRAQHRIQHAGIGDFQYLQVLAKKLNWDFYIDGVTLHFHHKLYEQASSLTFTYYTGGGQVAGGFVASDALLQFTPEINVNLPKGAGASGTSNQTGKSADGSGIAVGDANRNLLGPSTGPLVPGTNGGPNSFTGVGMQIATHESDPKVIALHGKQFAQKIDMNAMKADAEFIGTPQVKARTMVTLQGLDKKYVGNWRVSTSTHSIDSKGYHLKVKLRRNVGTANSKKDNTQGQSAHGNANLNTLFAP